MDGNGRARTGRRLCKQTGRVFATAGRLCALPLLLVLSAPLAAQEMARGMVNGNFNGLTVGGHLGVGVGLAGSTTTTGTLGGAQAAYNIQFNNALIGAEADVTGTSLHAKGFVAGSYKQNFLSSLRGRIGYVSGNLMVSATGGMGYTTLAYRDMTGVSDKTVTGWVGGATLSYLLTDKIILRADALHYHFGKTTFSTPATPNLPLASSTNLLRAGFDYKI